MITAETMVEVGTLPGYAPLLLLLPLIGFDLQVSGVQLATIAVLQTAAARRGPNHIMRCL